MLQEVIKWIMQYVYVITCTNDFGPPGGKGPIRYPLSVCLYVRMSQPPSLDHAYKFAEIWHEGRGPLV